jgi:predicted hotdog family 3-hydroxylacyl-ACP dehydratase
MADVTWLASTNAKARATLAASTRFRVITDPTGTPASQFTDLTDVRAYLLAQANTWAETQTLASAATLNWNGDTVLQRDGAADTLALRRSTNAQTLRVYNTWTDASNNEYIRIWYNSNLAFIQSTATGTGVTRALYLGTTGNAILQFRTQNADRYHLSGDGHLLASTDNTYDIGASGANRPRTGYFSSSVVTNVVRASNFNTENNTHTIWQTALSSPHVTFSLGTNNTLMRFGGTTSSFPALKRSATVLQARLADDSGFAPLQGNIRVHANATAEVVVATHTLRVFDAAGTEYKVLCVAA